MSYANALSSRVSGANVGVRRPVRVVCPAGKVRPDTRSLLRDDIPQYVSSLLRHDDVG
jgi:hypothetical protein